MIHRGPAVRAGVQVGATLGFLVTVELPVDESLSELLEGVAVHGS
jgi:hypothetical protein